MTSSTIRIGPSGWNYPDWNGVVYPPARRSRFHPLAFLAGRFDTVEIAETFRGPVRPEVSRLWLAKVSENANFAFTARLWRRFTHDRVLDAAEVGAFKDGLWPLLQAKRFGCLLLQFPWAFRFTAENREFLIRLRRAFHEFPMAVEMRHNSWMADEALGTLIDYRLGFSNIDQPEYARAMPATAFVTSPLGSVRLHGRNPRYWREEFGSQLRKAPARDYLYSAAELEEWKSRIQHVAAHSASVFVTLTNDPGGKSVVNALQLQRLLGVSTGELAASHRRVA